MSQEGINEQYRNRIFSLSSSLDTTNNKLTAVSGTLFLVSGSLVGPIINNLDNTPTTFGGISTIATITANKFYLAPPGNDFTASFTNLPTDNLKVTTIDVYLSQSSAAKEITAVKVNNTSSNVNWLNNSIPMVNAYKIDVYTFNILRVSSNWLVTGELKTYG
jgi:hypothetical protein